MNIFKSHKEILYFSRWSRKTYAIFACIGKEVHILHLNYTIIESENKIKKSSSEFPCEKELKFETDDDSSFNTETSIFFVKNLKGLFYNNLKLNFDSYSAYQFNKNMKMRVSENKAYSHFLFI